jgi:acetoin utilization deacetylase AcuC-like enzyme
MHKTIVIKDPCYLNHITGEYHPESPQRLQKIYSMLKDAELAGRFIDVHPRAATKEELSWNHARDYIERIEQTAGIAHTMLDPDTHASAGSWEAAVFAAGGVLSALEMLMEGRADNGFALVRPPGHHAESSRAMGFCLFNNVAVGAHYLIRQYKLERILIVDWDLHHGNGTQKSFYTSPEVLYCSTHQYPYYPGTGAIEEIGDGKGRGYTVNIPLRGGQGDADYIKLFQEIIIPVADAYKPEFILISAGYDPYYRDPLGAMQVTPEGFSALTALLMDCAQRHCGKRVLAVLEGGYHLDGITESVKKTLVTLIDNHAALHYHATPEKPLLETETVIKMVKKMLSPFWTGLS